MILSLVFISYDVRYHISVFNSKFAWIVRRSSSTGGAIRACYDWASKLEVADIIDGNCRGDIIG